MTKALTLTNSGNLQRKTNEAPFSSRSINAQAIRPKTNPPKCAPQSILVTPKASATFSPMLTTKKLADASILPRTHRHSSAPRTPEMPPDAPTVRYGSACV